MGILGLGAATDETIMEFARAKGQVLISADTDFSQLVVVIDSFELRVRRLPILRRP